MERMCHQLFSEESFAKGLVARIRSGPVLGSDFKVADGNGEPRLVHGNVHRKISAGLNSQVDQRRRHAGDRGILHHSFPGSTQ